MAKRPAAARKVDAISAAWPADAVERRSIASIVAYEKNARLHSPEQIKQIAASIKEFGFTIPVLVDENGVLIAGHGRLEGAKLLGLTELPVMTARGWTEAQIKAYRLADNAVALNAGWSPELLKLEFESLRALDFDLALTGFSTAEIGKLTSSGLTDPDDAPELPINPASRLGDIWLLGGHRLMCGDARSIEHVRALCVGVIPDLANCDPPYGINVVKGGSIGGAKAFGKVGSGARTRRVIKPNIYSPIIGDNSIETGLTGYKVLTGLGVRAIVLWGGNFFAADLPASRRWLIWDKQIAGNATFADAELAWTNQDAPIRIFHHQWSGLVKASERREKRVHPTQKPVALAEWVIETVAPAAVTVIDLFAGSGSTLIACERKGRIGLMMELSPTYVDVAVEKWQNFTGNNATLEATGQTFAEVKRLYNQLPLVGSEFFGSING